MSPYNGLIKLNCLIFRKLTNLDNNSCGRLGTHNNAKPQFINSAKHQLSYRKAENYLSQSERTVLGAED